MPPTLGVRPEDDQVGVCGLTVGREAKAQPLLQGVEAGLQAQAEHLCGVIQVPEEVHGARLVQQGVVPKGGLWGALLLLATADRGQGLCLWGVPRLVEPGGGECRQGEGQRVQEEEQELDPAEDLWQHGHSVRRLVVCTGILCVGVVLVVYVL